MTALNMSDPADMAKAVRMGSIWTAAPEVIADACKAIADGTIPAPNYIPQVWASYLQRLGWHRPTASTTGVGQ